MTGTFLKDPSAVLDYTIDWSDMLGADTIDDDVWTVPTGIVKDSNSHTTTAATVWLSGGTHGADYNVVCRVTTAGGRTDERTVKIQVRNR